MDTFYPSIHGKVWHNGEPTDLGIEVYTTGDCWILAYYASKILNSSVALIGGDSWGHICATVPGDDRLLDIKGLQAPKKLIGEYAYRGDKTIKELDISKYRNILEYRLDIVGIYSIVHLDKSYGPSLRTAQRTAGRLVEKYV